MTLLEQNILSLCKKNGITFERFKEDLDIEDVHELTVFDLEAICEEYDTDLMALLFKKLQPNIWSMKAKEIKLLLLDVDGVMTDGGMYFTESGDQSKKYHTHDGMAILHLTKRNFNVGIISSGFKTNMVKDRADLLGVSHFYVGRDKKTDILANWIKELNIEYSQIAMIGDDINDLGIINKVGFSACPSNAVKLIKESCDVILNKKGGEGCVREFIDTYLLDQPIS